MKVVRGIRGRLPSLGKIVERENRRFDERYGLDAGGIAEPDDLTVDGDAVTGFMYVATPVRLARWWLRELPPDLRRFTFVDMGSGKGRVLALAAAHGFGRVIGVEFARELHEVAVSNAAAAETRGLSFEPILGDAGAFAFPVGPLVVHFNNPFAESVMNRVIANLEAAYARDAAPMVLVYQQLTLEEERHSTRNLALLDGVPFLSGRSLKQRGLIDRRVLAPYTVRLYESREVREPDSRQ